MSKICYRYAFWQNRLWTFLTACYGFCVFFFHQNSSVCGNPILIMTHHFKLAWGIIGLILPGTDINYPAVRIKLNIHNHLYGIYVALKTNVHRRHSKLFWLRSTWVTAFEKKLICYVKREQIGNIPPPYWLWQHDASSSVDVWPQNSTVAGKKSALILSWSIFDDRLGTFRNVLSLTVIGEPHQGRYFR